MPPAPLRLGALNWNQYATWEQLLGAGVRADRLGYDTLWTWDHLYPIVGSHEGPMFEAWLTLAAWAQRTERIRIGLMVGANTFRNPAVVAKMVTTLDHQSGGRAILGIGAAWFETEHTAFGIDFGSGFGERLDWLEESIVAIRSLLAGETVSSPTGGHYAIHDLRHLPVPYRGPGTLPILVGGGGERRTLPIAARHADIWHHRGAVNYLARKLDLLREACEIDIEHRRHDGRSIGGTAG